MPHRAQAADPAVEKSPIETVGQSRQRAHRQLVVADQALHRPLVLPRTAAMAAMQTPRRPSRPAGTYRLITAALTDGKPFSSRDIWDNQFHHRYLNEHGEIITDALRLDVTQTPDGGRSHCETRATIGTGQGDGCHPRNRRKRSIRVAAPALSAPQHQTPGHRRRHHRPHQLPGYRQRHRHGRSPQSSPTSPTRPARNPARPVRQSRRIRGTTQGRNPSTRPERGAGEVTKTPPEPGIADAARSRRGTPRPRSCTESSGPLLCARPHHETLLVSAAACASSPGGSSTGPVRWLSPGRRPFPSPQKT